MYGIGLPIRSAPCLPRASYGSRTGFGGACVAELDRTQPRLIVFTDSARADPALSIERFTCLGARALSGSVLFVLRDYAMALRERFAFGQRLSALATSTAQRFGVAERADLARALGCTAFHLPGGGLTARDARDFLGPQ